MSGGADGSAPKIAPLQAIREFLRLESAGGILLLVHPRSDQDVGNARAVLERHAAQEIETPPDRSMV